jgi:molybdopterin/thiamine biosynthesis adenylyltransferase
MNQETLQDLTILAHPEARGGQILYVVRDEELLLWTKFQRLKPLRGYQEALRQGVVPQSLERNFPALSAEQQLRLLTSRVLIAGVGGLGGAQAMLLSRLGVGRLWLADGDVFTHSNLNRQIFAKKNNLGQKKAQVTARALRAIAPALEVQAIPHQLTALNLPAHLAGIQVVLDGLDTAKARIELAAAAKKVGLPLVHGAVVGQFGQVSTIMPNDTFSVERLFPDKPASQTETTRDVLAPVVSLVASLQVQEAVRLLLGQPPAYHNHLAHFDGQTGRLEIVPLG